MEGVVLLTVFQSKMGKLRVACICSTNVKFIAAQSVWARRNFRTRTTLEKIPHWQNYEQTKAYEKFYLKHKSIKEVLVMWECDFKNLLKTNSALQTFVSSLEIGPPVVEKRMTEERVIELIIQG